MSGIDELSRIIGKFEVNIKDLTTSQNKIIAEQKRLNALLSKKLWRDSAKVVGGAFVGGFTAVFVKLGIWGG